MNFYNLPVSSEITGTLKSIMMAMARGDEQVIYNGKELKERVSRKGTRFYTFKGGLPVEVAAFEVGEGLNLTLKPNLVSKWMEEGETKERKMTVRGKVKKDRRGEPNVFFFDPEVEGFHRGVFRGKMSLVADGLVDIRDAFTVEEVREQALAGTITWEEGAAIVRELE